MCNLCISMQWVSQLNSAINTFRQLRAVPSSHQAAQGPHQGYRQICKMQDLKGQVKLRMVVLIIQLRGAGAGEGRQMQASLQCSTHWVP